MAHIKQLFGNVGAALGSRGIFLSAPPPSARFIMSDRKRWTVLIEWVCQVCHKRWWLKIGRNDYLWEQANECPTCDARTWPRTVQFEEGEGEVLKPLYKLRSGKEHANDLF